MSETRKVIDILKRLGPAGVLAVIASILPPIGAAITLTFIQSISSYLRSQASVGLLIYASMVMVGCGLAMLPTISMAALSGWAFGFAVGFPVSLASFTAASVVGYVVARTLSGTRAVQVIDSNPKWAAVHRAILGGTWRRTLALVTLIRLPPNSPFAVTNLVLAVTRVRPDIYILGTMLGMAPRTAVVVWLGAMGAKVGQKIGESQFEASPGNWYLTIAGIIVALAVVGTLFHIANRAIKDATTRFIESPPV